MDRVLHHPNLTLSRKECATDECRTPDRFPAKPSADEPSPPATAAGWWLDGRPGSFGAHATGAAPDFDRPIGILAANLSLCWLGATGGLEAPLAAHVVDNVLACAAAVVTGTVSELRGLAEVTGPPALVGIAGSAVLTGAALLADRRLGRTSGLLALERS